MGVLQPLEQIQFLSHPVSPHQLLVHLFDRDGAFSSPVIATLDDREAPPGGYTRTQEGYVVFLTQPLRMWTG